MRFSFSVIPSPVVHRRESVWSSLRRVLCCMAGVWVCTVQAQNLPVSPQQRATAQQVAEAGVPLDELAPDAPERHTVVRGDTLWGISGLFLRSPWRWPELWGMNLSDIRNPHRIYPGQVLVLDRSNGRALLRLAGNEADVPTVRLSPRMRSEPLPEFSIPLVSLQAITPFLTEGLVVDETVFANAPRLVAAPEGRVLLSRGDRAYARSMPDAPGGLLGAADGSPRQFRVFRSVIPLKDPATGAVLGFEAQYVGRVQLVREEQRNPVMGPDGSSAFEAVPALVDVVETKAEMGLGDRLLPEPPRQLTGWLPRAPDGEQNGQIVSVYGNAVRFAGQNQVVALNRGTEHGMAPGHVLAVLKGGQWVRDTTLQPASDIRLPLERNGLMVVFRVFSRVSYALVLQITDTVKVGDAFANP